MTITPICLWRTRRVFICSEIFCN